MMTLLTRGGFIGLLPVVCLFVGCAYFSKAASVQTAVSEQGLPDKAGKVAVPLFLHEKYKAGEEKVWPDSTITDRFVTGLVQHGYHVLDRARIRKMMRENDIRPTDLYNENNIQKIGMLLHADTVVLGKLTLVEKEDGTTLSRKLNVRAIRVLDGAVLFSISSLDATMYRVLTGEDLVDQGIADLFRPKGSGADSSSPLKATASASVSMVDSEGRSDDVVDGAASSGREATSAMDTSFGEEMGEGMEDDVEAAGSPDDGEAVSVAAEDGLYENADQEPVSPETEAETTERDTDAQ